MQKKLLVLLSLVMGITLTSLIFLAGSSIMVQAEEAGVNAPDLPESPEAVEDYVYNTWDIGPASPFAFTRFDAEYSLETGHIYVLGGRLSDSSTDGSIWEFNPATGVYTDTGVDLPTPISNYQIARLVDGSGEEVLMIFGGRPAAGGVVNNVQGYKPGSNTVVDYTVTDPYPVATSPGGLGVVNNIAYIFGGFDAVGTIADTYIFDITAAAGSRFTSGPPLSQARSYIPSAVLDGMIYALGGDDFDGTGLIPLTITEKLDPTNLGAGWDDAGVADMPIACEEAPAFGFDSTSAYDLAGAIVIAGCGQWPDEIAEAQLYDLATDSWDGTFPDLNEARRNHAGAFVPNGNGVDGLPGMWLFGGIQEADANVLTDPEYYSVTPLGNFTLFPKDLVVSGFGTYSATLGAANRSGAAETFDLSYSNTLSWIVSGPATVTVGNGEVSPFTMDITVPGGANCFDQTIITVDGIGQTNTTLSDTVQVTAQYFCPTGIMGTITDTNTGMSIPNAYIYMQNVADSGNEEGGFADANGDFLITDVPTGTYYVAVSAKGYEFSILPQGWPAGADVVTITQAVLLDYNKALDAPILEMEAPALDQTVYIGNQLTQTIVVTNSGTSDLHVSFGTYGDNVQPPPRLSEPKMPETGYRVDPRILLELEISESGTTDFIVYFQDQADLSAAYTIDDWDVRGQYVYETLRQTADKSQAGVRQLLDNAGTPYRSFISANALLVQSGDISLINQLAGRAEVAYLLVNDAVQLQTPTLSLWQRLVNKAQTVLAPTAIEWGVKAVNADVAWTNGVVGSGVIVANIDSGVEWTHEALVNQYRGGVGDHDYNWYMPTSGCAGQTEPCDNDGHGTHTMGTIVGSTDPATPLTATNGIGVAPGAEWIACKGCEANSCSFEALLACGDWMVAPTDLNGMNPDPTKRPHVVNNSWGGGGGDFWYGGVVGAWRASGIFPQFSAGNSGPTCSTTGAPGDYWMNYAAAAIDVGLNAATFSSRGPAAITGILKPNISAPGVNVRSSVPGNAYANFNGTSMASPHVAGAVALLWSTEPELIGEIEDTMWLLSQTASPLYTTDTCGGDIPTTHPNHTFGWGLVDAAAAITNSADVALPWLDVMPIGATIPPGASVPFDVVFNPAASGTFTGTIQVTADEPYNPEQLLPVTLTVPGAVAQAGFGSNSPVAVGETAVFTNTSTGEPPITYLWEFGDGITSTLPSPTHTYAAAGTYTVTLTATNGGGSSVSQSSFTVIEFNAYLPIVIKE